MNECLILAKKGFGNVAPNPMVGCVIVYNNQIIGSGFHEEYGKAHAEVNAIKSVQDKSLLKSSTLYVNLEPCAHYGKTPPCADLIVTEKIPHVVIGAIDEHSKVAGKGIEKLQKAGIKVEVDVLKKECIELNKRFYTFHTKQRPYIILKWAQTQDHYISRLISDPLFKTDNWITSEGSKIWVHQRRAEEQAILVGAQTVIKDNPTLTTRLVQGNNPLRIIISKAPLENENLNIYNDDAPTINFNTQLEKKDGQHKWIKFDGQIQSILPHLHKRDIQSVIIEGGSATLRKFIAANLWDEAFVFEGDKTFNKGLEAPVLNGEFQTSTIGTDQLFHFINQSPV